MTAPNKRSHANLLREFNLETLHEKVIADIFPIICILMIIDLAVISYN